MLLTNFRYSTTLESTSGVLLVDQDFVCYTLEDPYHELKIPGRTRIASGLYDVILRTHGSKHEDYLQRFPALHRGMLEIANVPNYTDVLIHIGNTVVDTAGCLLVGDQPTNNQIGQGKLINSTSAYIRFYSKVIPALSSGEQVRIQIGDPVELLKVV